MPISEVAGASKEAVNHPSHYAAHYRREVIELTSHFDFTTGNALKYVLRCRFKGRPTEDLQKLTGTSITFPITRNPGS